MLVEIRNPSPARRFHDHVSLLHDKVRRRLHASGLQNATNSAWMQRSVSKARVPLKSSNPPDTVYSCSALSTATACGVA